MPVNIRITKIEKNEIGKISEIEGRNENNVGY